MRSRLHERRAGQRCPFCRDRPPDGAWAVCQGCRARHHVDCWREGDGCASCRAPTPRVERAPRPARWRPSLLLVAVQALVVLLAALAVEVGRVGVDEDGPLDLEGEAALDDAHLAAARRIVDELALLVAREELRQVTLVLENERLERELEALARDRDPRLRRLTVVTSELESDLGHLRAQLLATAEQVRLHERALDRLPSEDRCEPRGPAWRRGEVLGAAPLADQLVISLGQEQVAVGQLVHVFRDGRLRGLLRVLTVRAAQSTAKVVDLHACPVLLDPGDTVVVRR